MIHPHFALCQCPECLKENKTTASKGNDENCELKRRLLLVEESRDELLNACQSVVKLDDSYSDSVLNIIIDNASALKNKLFEESLPYKEGE